MKKTIIIIEIVLLLVLAGFFMSQKNNSTITQETQKNKVVTSQKNKVAATIFPLYDITRQIAGNEFEVSLILPSGASPHTFDPQPSLFKKLQGTQAIFAIGHGLDDWTIPIAKSINAPIVSMDENINLRDAIDTDEGPIDPHYWLDIDNAKQITLNIAHELSRLDVKHADIYTARANTYIEKLNSLKGELTNKTKSLSNKNIISLHDAWYYFAGEFALNILGTFEPSPGKEPTPGYIAKLKKAVEKTHVSTLFIEPQLSQASIRSFVNDHNLKVASIDPLGGVDGRDSYIELMRYNVGQVVTALSQ